MKLKKPVAHNIHTNTVEPIKEPTIRTVSFITKEYDQLMALFRKENSNNQSFTNTIGITTSTCNNTQYGSHSTLNWIMDSSVIDHIPKSPLSQNKLDINHDFVN